MLYLYLLAALRFSGTFPSLQLSPNASIITPSTLLYAAVFDFVNRLHNSHSCLQLFCVLCIYYYCYHYMQCPLYDHRKRKSKRCVSVFCMKTKWKGEKGLDIRERVPLAM